MYIGVIMLMVGKMERMEGEDFYNDDWNIDEIEAKDEVSEDLKVLMEDWKNVKFNGQPVSMKLLIMSTQLLPYGKVPKTSKM